VVNQLFRAALDGEKPMSYWKEWQEYGWILVWCLWGSAIGLLVRSPWRFSLLLTASMLLLGLIAWFSFRAGCWIPLVPPALACIPAAALVTSYVSHQEKLQRSQLMQLFSRHVSREVADAVWAQRDDFLQGNRPRSQRVIATVLFTDLARFTTLSESLDPGVLMDWLNEYLEAMAKIVMRNGGMVDKYIGDAIMAVFGVPVPRTSEEAIKQDAANAVRCALEMKQEMDRLNARWQPQGRPTTRMRVGIHTGPLLAGSVGSAERMDYTVLGDTVNTAKRLEAYDKDLGGAGTEESCRILIGESTKILLTSDFEAICAGKMDLKGKSEKVMVFRVVNKPPSPGA
jgi:adenylate cyclase